MKSDNVKKGMQQAPHRSLFNALGLTEEEMDKPLICLLYTSPSPRDRQKSRMPSSA